MSNMHDTKLRRLDFSLLLIFQEVYRRRRANAAAERLGLSQPAISHALARLRDALGDPLFERHPDGLRPTPAAVGLAPKIDLLLSLATEIAGQRQEFDPGTSNRCFKISANDFGGTLLTVPLIAALAAKAPSARLAIGFAGGPQAAYRALRNGDLDIAIGRFPDRPEDCVAEQLFIDDFQIIARKGHPAIGHSIDLDLYLGLRHLVVSFAGDLRGTVDDVLERMGHKRTVVASSPTFLGTFAAVAESDLVATMPRRLVRRYAGTFGLNVYEPPFAMDGFTIDLLTARKISADPGIDWLLEEITLLLSDEPMRTVSSPPPP